MTVSTRFHFEDGKMVTQRTQDCTPIAERAKALHNEGIHGSSDMKHAASIPMVIVESYCNLHNIEFSEFMQNKEHIKRLCNDPNFSHFRVWPGRL
jgi:hypothetical protein